MANGVCQKHHGGDGLIREIELLADAQVTLLADRRKTAPWGLAGGYAGEVGKTSITTNGEEQSIAGKCTKIGRAHV